MQKSPQCYKYKVLFKAYQFSWSVFCCAEWINIFIYHIRSRQLQRLGLGLISDAERLVSVSDLCVSGLVSVSAWKVSCTSLVLCIVYKLNTSSLSVVLHVESISVYFLFSVSSFSALTLLVGQQQCYLACKLSCHSSSEKPNREKWTGCLVSTTPGNPRKLLEFNWSSSKFLCKMSKIDRIGFQS